MKTLDFKKIEKFDTPNYIVDVPLDFIKEKLERWTTSYKLELDPEFQRGHVWSEKQQIEFIEFLLKGGQVHPIFFNMEGWMGTQIGKLQLIDGKQRLTAILKFIDSELPIFDGYTIEQLDNFRLGAFSVRFGVNKLSEKDAIDWYISMNTGGTIHTSDEIQKAIEYKKTIK